MPRLYDIPVGGHFVYSWNHNEVYKVVRDSEEEGKVIVQKIAAWWSHENEWKTSVKYAEESSHDDPIVISVNLTEYLKNRPGFGMRMP